jgi:hypothetical protein
MPRSLPKRDKGRRPPVDGARVLAAYDRLFRAKALQMLVRGALPPALIRKLLSPTFGTHPSFRVPDEAWASIAAKFALDTPVVGLSLAEALGDRLGWDEEPSRPEDWQRLAEERPLEALWLGALSEDKAVRKGYPKVAASAIRAFTSSPACPMPSWEFVDILLDLQAQGAREVDRLLKAVDDLERRIEADRQRADDLRDEAKRLRRENAELRADRAAADKRAAAAVEARARAAVTPDGARLDEAERRLRKAEKEAEHLRRELDRRDAAPAREPALEMPAAAPKAVPSESSSGSSIAQDGNPRRRVLRQVLKKLFKKGKIGASHTHEDNVYRGVADHDKGLAKEAMDLLYREGLLMPKPTTTDPHVSLRPERTAEVRAIVAGEITNPRLARFVEEAS